MFCQQLAGVEKGAETVDNLSKLEPEQKTPTALAVNI